MYQMIDDADEGLEPLRPSLTVWPFVVGLLGAAIVFTGVWLISPGPATQAPTDQATPAARTDYLDALSEPRPALRRARLLDFQARYPDSARLDAVRDQLAIIDAAETRDWDRLIRTVYDVRAEDTAKLEAMAAYETRWDGRLMGGRGEELSDLRADISEIEGAQPLPDRRMEAGDSPIPDDTPADELAGGPPSARPVAIYVPPPAPTKPVSVVEAVVQPTVRRNVSPRYPRKAQRRKISATVVLALDIDARGRVMQTDVISVEAPRYEKDFIKASERAALKMRFNPKRVNGEAVPARGLRKRYLFRAGSE